MLVVADKDAGVLAVEKVLEYALKFVFEETLEIIVLWESDMKGQSNTTVTMASICNAIWKRSIMCCTEATKI